MIIFVHFYFPFSVHCYIIIYKEGRKLQKENVVTVEFEEEIPPDVSAIKFWLANRQKGRWCDNPHKVSNDREHLKLKKQQIEQGAW